MRNIFLKNQTDYNFGMRLRYLMNTHTPILKNAAALSEAMHEKGILKYEKTNREGKPKTEKECIRNKEKTINDHLGYSDCANVSVTWIKYYCTFFKCSADYLLGYIDLPTHTTTDIFNVTGLSPNAIKSLSRLKNLSKYFPGSQDDKFSIINLILSDSHEKESLSSLLDMITGFCRFNISGNNDKMYTVDKNGITNFQYTPSMSGKGGSYNPLKAHFHLQDMESMYYLKIWDSIKELKEIYQEKKKTLDANQGIACHHKNP